MNQKYEDFLKSKITKVSQSGFDISESELNPALFDFQKHIVKKAIKQGRYAIFADTGLGKTIMQLSGQMRFLNIPGSLFKFLLRLQSLDKQ
jgi:superfamily II DNA or RNA helicase